MKKSLPYLLALAFSALTASVAAQSPAATAGRSPSSGDNLLLQAAAQLDRRASITARLRHQLDLAAKQIYGIGGYWQVGSGDELKVRMELQIAGQEAQLLQVSNSRYLWVDRRLPTGRFVSRVDLRQLRRDPLLSTGTLGEIAPGEADWQALKPELVAHSGGLPSLLSSLSANFQFLPPQAMRLAITPPLATEEINVSVFAIVGHWREERLRSFLKSSETDTRYDELDQTDLVQELPERFPQEVLLLFGQADRFPYRIEYRKLETPSVSSGQGPLIPYQLSVQPMAVLEFSDVAFDVPIDPGQFDYTLRDVVPVDQTALVLEKLRRARRGNIATRTHALSPSSPAR